MYVCVYIRKESKYFVNIIGIEEIMLSSLLDRGLSSVNYLRSINIKLLGKM